LALFSTVLWAQDPVGTDSAFDFDAVQKLDATWESLPHPSIVLPDGKIVLGMSYYNGIYSGGTTRINPNGSRDMDYSITGPNDMHIRSMALQGSGKIILGGSFTEYMDNFSQPYNRIGRYNSDGTKDETFLIGSGFNHIVRKVIVLPDDKILVFGYFTTYQGTSAMRIVKLNADGTRDNTFTVGTGFDNLVYDAVLQPDGKIVAAGRFYLVQGAAHSKIVRFNADGTIDPTFVSPGYIDGEEGITSIALQSDGKILLRGDFSSIGSSSKGGIARLNTDGSIDNSFETGIGMFNNATNPSAEYGKIAIAPDGKIVTSTMRYQGLPFNGYVRLEPNGAIDATFNVGQGTDRAVKGDLLDGWINEGSISFDANGKILIGYFAETFDDYFSPGYVRLNNDGSVDHSFNVGKAFKGKVLTLAKQPDGKILAGGVFSSYNATLSKRLARINTNGSIDPTFNIGAGFDYEVKAVVPQPDGKILVGGKFSNFNGYNCLGIVRLNADGSRDTSFNLAVPLTPADSNVGAKVYISTIVLQADGKITLAGDFKYNFQQVLRRNMVRLNANGTIDASFLVAPDFTSGNHQAILQADGKIIVTGGHYTGNIGGLYRINADGTRDNAFNTGTGFGGGTVTKIWMLSNGKIMATGSFTSFNGSPAAILIRINPDGTRDTSFSMTAYNLNPSFSSVAALCEQPDGKVLLSGKLMLASSSAYDRFVRLHADGSKDTSFSVFYNDNAHLYPNANSIIAEPDGKILMGGYFYALGTNIVNHLTRLSGDGSVDTSFNDLLLAQTAFEPNAQSLFLYPNPVKEKLYILFEVNLPYEIYNTTGQRLIAGTAGKEGVDTSGLPGGIYLMVLGTGSQKTTRKFIKQ